jgi:hypothetical protein
MRAVGCGRSVWRTELALGEGSGCGGVVVGTTVGDADGEGGVETGTPLVLELGGSGLVVDGAGGTGKGSGLSGLSPAIIEMIAIGRPMIATAVGT